MEGSKGKSKRSSGNLIIKTWERCKCLGLARKSSSSVTTLALTKKSKSWPQMKDVTGISEDRGSKPLKKRRAGKEKGCFSVYVGQEKQRFVIKTEYANHPLFRVLLEEAESEYGFNSGGPLVLPCNVDLFCKVLLAIDDGGSDDIPRQWGCGFPKGHSGYRLLSSPMIAINQSQSICS
ncbi:hypothetical protein SLE2022_048540 [Rubroshorea leprosula]